MALIGCSAQDPGLSPEQRWPSLNQLSGWTMCIDLDEAVEEAHLKRHPNHVAYVPVSSVNPLADAEVEEYGRLNQALHEQLRSLSHEHFASVPIPAEIREKRGDETYFTPFTYQHYDWYGPTYECYIAVLADYISADLLARFQSLLRSEYRDWCIVVVASEDLDFDTDHEIAVFSDQVLVPVSAIEALSIPARTKDRPR
jgi:hypothetical protein